MSDYLSKSKYSFLNANRVLILDSSKQVVESSVTDTQLLNVSKILITGSGTKFLSDDGTYKPVTIEGGYLPLSGGTMTGDIKLKNDLGISFLDSNDNTLHSKLLSNITGAHLYSDNINIHTYLPGSSVQPTGNFKFSGADLYIDDYKFYNEQNAAGAVSSVMTTNLQSDRAVISNSSGKLAISNVTSTQLNYLTGSTSNIQNQLNLKAPLISPALSGTPTAPTAASSSSSTQIATTAFVKNSVNDYLPLIGGNMQGDIVFEQQGMGTMGNGVVFQSAQGEWAIKSPYAESTLDFVFSNSSTAEYAPILSFYRSSTGDYSIQSRADFGGNADSASRLQTSRTITNAGDMVGSVSFNGTNNVTLNNTRRGCIVGQSGNSANTTAKPWFKVASIKMSGANIDSMITFYVQTTYNQINGSGILKVRFRTGSASTIEVKTLDWLVIADDLSQDNFVIAWPTTANPVCELWCKQSQPYTGYTFDVLEEGDRVSRQTNLWTLYNTFTDGGQAAITSGYTTLTSSVRAIRNKVVNSVNYINTNLTASMPTDL